MGRYAGVQIVKRANNVKKPGKTIVEYWFGPDGLEFGKPITVTMTIDITPPPEGKGDNLYMCLYDPDLDAFVEVPESDVTVATVTNADGSVDMVFTTQVSHFSAYAVVEEIIDATDTTPPAVGGVVVPAENESLQDSVILRVEATDKSAIDGVSFTIRENIGETGVDIGYEGISATQTVDTDEWTLAFDSRLLLDGNYLIFATAVDQHGNEGTSEVVHFTIRNWSLADLLPASMVYRTGRTIPVKFAVRMDPAIDPSMAFVRNEALEVRIFKALDSGDILLQIAQFGDTSTDYRIDGAEELYITNFRTDADPAVYIVEIWRGAIDFLIGSFSFETEQK